jgi:hypothetical protein
MREEKMKKYFVFVFCLLFAALFVSCDVNKKFKKAPEANIQNSEDGQGSTPGTDEDSTDSLSGEEGKGSTPVSTPVKTGSKVTINWGSLGSGANNSSHSDIIVSFNVDGTLKKVTIPWNKNDDTNSATSKKIGTYKEKDLNAFYYWSTRQAGTGDYIRIIKFFCDNGVTLKTFSGRKITDAVWLVKENDVVLD